MTLRAKLTYAFAIGFSVGYSVLGQKSRARKER